MTEVAREVHASSIEAPVIKEKPKVCKMLPANASKAEKKLAHIVKMGMKKKLNEHNRLSSMSRPEYVLANQSQHHENFGETPAQQAQRMREKSS